MLVYHTKVNVGNNYKAMKTLIIFNIIILLGINAYPQSKLTGKYCRLAEGVLCNIKEYDNCLTFLTDYKFEYFNNYDLTESGFVEFGTGSYYISEDTLCLYFTKYETELKNNFDIQKTLNPHSDSISIDIQIYDKEDNVPISWANVYINVSENSEYSKILGGCNTDVNGHGYFTIAKYSSTIYLMVKYIDCQPSIIELNNDYNYKIIGHLVLNNKGRIK